MIRSLHFGGAERQLVALACGLHSRGHSVCVATFYPGGELEADLERAGVHHHSIGKRSRWDLIGFVARTIKFVKRYDPQIIHGYMDTANVLTALLRPFVPRARIVFGVRASNWDLGAAGMIYRAAALCERICSRFADLIVCNSYSGSAFCARNGYPARKLLVIPNGIEMNRFAPDGQARVRLRREWNVPDDELLIGLVGRLDRLKDHGTFLRMAKIVSDHNSMARFVCVGDGPEPYRKELLDLAATLAIGDRVIWAGARHDMPAVYSALDMLVSSSTTEAFSNVIGEAMAAGVPCVVTDVGDSARIVRHLGRVAPPRDSAALASAVCDQINSVSDGQSQRLRADIGENFGVERMIDRTESALWTTIQAR